MKFNKNFLNHNNENTLDISLFESRQELPSGYYDLNVILNNNPIGIKSFFIDNGNVFFSKEQIENMGIQKDKILYLIDNNLLDIKELIHGSNYQLKSEILELNISIPQAFMKSKEYNYVSPSSSDKGINAFFTDYNLNLWSSTFNRETENKFYLHNFSGLNIGSWRLRNNLNITVDKSLNYHSINTYIQKDIDNYKSQLTVGQNYTSAELFDSVPFFGVQMASDIRMLSDSQRNFAPVVKGVANTNARISIKQGDNIIYETNVSPGPFSIDDIQGSGYAGDVEVTVNESDGNIQKFVVPFSTLPQLIRPKSYRYEAVIGKYNSGSTSINPYFLQGSYKYGLDDMTIYIGNIISERYMSTITGFGVNTQFGAIAIDVTESSASKIKETRKKGRSYRLSYSKTVEPTNTTLNLAAYRFSNKDYLNFSDYVNLRESDFSFNSQRNKFVANINQNLPNNLGNFYIIASLEDYWKSQNKSNVNYQFGYNNQFGWGSLNLSVNKLYNNIGINDTQYRVGFSIPIHTGSNNFQYLTSSISHSDVGDGMSQIGISGIADNNNQLTYNGYISKSNRNKKINQAGVSLSYLSHIASLNSNLSISEQFYQIGFGSSGSILLHSDGANFSASQGETKALIKASGAKGANLRNNIISRVNDEGYAVVSGLTPYRYNLLSIDPKNTNDNVELKTTEKTIAPKYGAIVKVDYQTIIGYPVILILTDENGGKIPVGAEVKGIDNEISSFVGQGSRVYFRTSNLVGKLIIKWGSRQDQNCVVSYNLTNNNIEDFNFLNSNEICHKEDK